MSWKQARYRQARSSCHEEQTSSACNPPRKTKCAPSLDSVFFLNRLRRRVGNGGRCGRRGRIVILRVLIVIILRKRSIDVIENHARHIHLPAIKQFQSFAGQTSRSIREAHDKKRGVDLWGETGGVIRGQDRRAIDNDVIV